MPNKNEEFLKRLLSTFRIEANEHIQGMSSGLMELEKVTDEANRTAIIEKIYREAHSLKGAARAVNLSDIESVCQSLESVYAALKRSEIAISPALMDLLYQAMDLIGSLLTREPGSNLSITPMINHLEEAVKGHLPEEGRLPNTPMELVQQPIPAKHEAEVIVETKATAVVPDMPYETIRVSGVVLDTVMREAEELLGPRLAANQRIMDLQEASDQLAKWKRQREKIQSVLRLLERSNNHPGKEHRKSQGELVKVFEYLEAESFTLKNLEENLRRLSKTAEHDHRSLSGMVDSLLQNMREMHMMPFSSLLEGMPRFVREFSRDHGKQIELATIGTDIEIDRRILEVMKEPLIHLLRNAIDHGIEKPDLREKLGKSPQGGISIAVSQKDSGKVEIKIADDGAGILPDRVKEAALKNGIRTADELEKLGEQDVLNLIFQSGISTSPIITDASGRGLGLAIVREKVDGLGGNLTLETDPEIGTSFRITLPLMLATFRGILLRSGGQHFVLPSISVEQVLRVSNDDIRTVENLETISLDGHSLSLVWLSDVLEIPRKTGQDEQTSNVQVVIIRLGHERIAFRVDEILGEQEVLVKTLGPQLVRVRNVAGASVLGTGQVVPVLNAHDLMKSAIHHVSAPVTFLDAAEPMHKHSILVAEDSITSRSLLKNILESANYQVTTTVDGMDAFTTLKSGDFDLLVSDVEMPRMDGFGLTAKVRADKQLSELPIVLVTALESREHRERGIDVGANAYIVKSSFDQSNLLEVIGRLI